MAEVRPVSKLTESYKALQIHNAWGFAGHGNPYITYHAADNGRGGRCAQWVVVRPGYQTDPNAHFLDHGCKTFGVWGKDVKTLKLQYAREWAGKKYGITEWDRTPFGSWMDAGFVKARLAELKALLETRTQGGGE
jgi:hypothetical protein